MLIGKVVGSVVSTRQNENLRGNKFMIVEPLEGYLQGHSRIVAVDDVGAGIGEKVLIATGSAARLGIQNQEAPVDATIVGIVDEKQG